MPSATPDSWNNPLISPPPPSPAMVGTRYRDTSPSADPDYEARYPEAPVNLSEPASPADITPSPISRQPSTSKSHHRSESIPKTAQKKKRVRAPSGGIIGREDGDADPATPRLSRPQHRQPGPGYNNVPLNYYPPPPQYQSSLDGYSSHGNNNIHPYASTGGYPGPGYYYNGGYGGGTNNSYSPPPPGHIYPPPPRMEYDNAYYGNSYTPTHLPSPPPVGSGKLDAPTLTEPGLEYPKKFKSRSQEGLSREFYENDKDIGVQNNGALLIGAISSIEEAKEVEGKEGGECPENEDPTEKEKEDIKDKKSIPMSHSSSRKSLHLSQLSKMTPTSHILTSPSP